MDSMGSLDSSLPSSRPQRATPPDLLQAFRTAALSVTNLYKSAAAEQASARQAGYQDALEDLLNYLDEKNIGVQDGEGWRIRQWATQRYDGGSHHQHSDIDDESDNEQRRNVMTRVPEERGRAASEPTTHNGPGCGKENEETTSNQEPIFRFTGNHHQDVQMQTDNSSSEQGGDHALASPIRVEVINRSKSGLRSSTTRSMNRSSPRDFTFSAGTKRKLNFPDFFDISSIPDRRDGGGGSKRGRFA